MKVLLDEDLDHRLRKKIEMHEVFTVRYLGWSGLKNGELLTTAEQNGIDVFVTADQNLTYQQNLSGRRMAIVVLSAANWPIIKITSRPFQQQLTGPLRDHLKRWSVAGSAGSYRKVTRSWSKRTNRIMDTNENGKSVAVRMTL